MDPATLIAKLVDITNGNDNESKALSAARDAVSKIGNAPIGNLTGVIIVIIINYFFKKFKNV